MICVEIQTDPIHPRLYPVITHAINYSVFRYVLDIPTAAELWYSNKFWIASQIDGQTTIYINLRQIIFQNHEDTENPVATINSVTLNLFWFSMCCWMVVSNMFFIFEGSHFD